MLRLLSLACCKKRGRCCAEKPRWLVRWIRRCFVKLSLMSLRHDLGKPEADWDDKLNDASK